MDNLYLDIKYLQGVGPVRAQLLDKELGIKTVGDLLGYYPYKYVDRTHIINISDIDGNMPYVQFKGEILSVEQVGVGGGRRLVAHFSDGTGLVDLVWFKGAKFILKSLELHKPYLVFGTPKVFQGRINIAHPEMERLAAEGGVRSEEANSPFMVSLSKPKLTCRRLPVTPDTFDTFDTGGALLIRCEYNKFIFQKKLSPQVWTSKNSTYY